MTTKYNAQALMDEVQKEYPRVSGYTLAVFAAQRAIEQHEAFRQEVSKVMTYIKALYPTLPTDYDRFIIPAPKPDPLVEVVKGVTWYDNEITAKEIRAALEARGLEIREKNDEN